MDERVAKARVRVGVHPISEKSWFDIGQTEGLKATLAHLGAE